MMEGHTSAGAKWKISVMYSRDMRLVNPTEKTLFMIMPHRELTLWARLESSPEANFLKKLTGRDKMRIMTDASTAWEVLVLIRLISRERTMLTIWDAKAEHSRKVITPPIRFVRRSCKTGPVKMLYTRGSILPTSVTAKVARTIRIKSLWEMLFFMYSIRSGMPNFFMGSGR